MTSIATGFTPEGVSCIDQLRTGKNVGKNDHFGEPKVKQNCNTIRTIIFYLYTDNFGFGSILNLVVPYYNMYSICSTVFVCFAVGVALFP